MTQFKKICAVIALAFTTGTAFAGGILTNTNQSVDFLRNPARDAAIGVDGVYSNPAGVSFLGDGFHFAFNWQAAFQTRTVETTNPLFATGFYNDGATTKSYEGKAQAPFLPSIHAAYNKDKWSLQFGFGVVGGGGKCTFDKGLGSFEGAVAQIGAGLNPLGAQGYNANYFMRGKQYFFGFTVGAAYQATKNLSVYVGARALYATTSYKATIENIQVNTGGQLIDFGMFLDGANMKLNSQYNDLLTAAGGINDAQMTEMYAALKPNYNNLPAIQKALVDNYEKIKGAQGSLKALEVYRNGVNLQCDQSGFGVAPIIGVDYKIANFNFAAKYEFATKMSLKNSSTLKEAMAIEAINQFKDGEKVREDMPALLTVGAQWNVVPSVRLNAGYHCYFDKQAQKYGNKQDLLGSNTMEYLGGVEWDAVKNLTISAGVQFTDYGLKDEYMSDLSFVVDSWSFGLGAKYQINEKVAVNAAYFQTNYDHYKTATDANTGVCNDFTRSNHVLGVGVELNF